MTKYKLVLVVGDNSSKYYIKNKLLVNEKINRYRSSLKYMKITTPLQWYLYTYRPTTDSYKLSKKSK